MIGTILLYGINAVPAQVTDLQLNNLASISPDITIEETADIVPEVPLPDDENDEDDNDEDFEPYDFASDLIIAALNPGYTVTIDGDKLSDVGEFIELQNLTDAPLVLAGYSLRYTNTTGKTVTIFTFPEGSYMTGKHLLLRYRKSPEAEQADATYSTSLAMKSGPLELYYEDELADDVCWTSKTDCVKEFKNDSSTSFRTSLVRNLATGEFEHFPVADYMPNYNPDIINFVIPNDEEDADAVVSEQLPSVCNGLEFSEILTYYVNDKSEQFIEFFNPTGADINLTGCQINFKNKLYPLSGVVASGDYYAFYNGSAFALTKNPTNPLILTLLDANGDAVDEMSYGNGQKKSTSFAKTYDEQGLETWRLTYAITPNAENIYQKFQTCAEGKVINEATGNCVKSTTLASSTLLAPCPEGKYRNPLTGRCKSITTASSTLTPCAEGYERNPETNRCRKITQPNEGADYALAPNTRSDSTVFVGIGIVAIIITLGGTYVVLQFRNEITRTLRKARQRINDISKDLFSRSIGRYRNKKS